MIEIYKRIILVIILLAGLSAAFCLTLSAEKEYDEIFARNIHEIKKYVVTIESYYNNIDVRLCRIGTGLILNKNGLILTRKSVIVNSDSIIVVNGNDQQAPAWVVFEKNGVVLLITNLSIEEKPTFYTDIDDLSPLAVLGNSFGIFPSVMLGEYGGNLANGYKKISIYLAPGNAGSPVINAQGQIIGLITGRYNLYSDDFQGDNLGVFIPIHLVFQSIKEFIQPNRGWIGITVVDETKDEENLIKVIRVIKGSPADKADIRAGDLITAFEDSQVHTTADIAARISEYEALTRVTFKISRGQKLLSKKVMIGDPIIVRDHSE